MKHSIAALLDQYSPNKATEPVGDISTEPSDDLSVQWAQDGVGQNPDPRLVDDQTPEPSDISRLLEQYGQPAIEQPADVPPPADQVLDDLKTRFSSGPDQLSLRADIPIEGFKKGFADFAALPGYAVDLVNWPLHKLGITPESSYGDSEMIRKGWLLLTGYKEVEPKTTTERYVRTISEFAGGSLLPGAGIVAKVAGRGAPVAAKTRLGAPMSANAKQAALRDFHQIKGVSKQLPKMTAPATQAELRRVIGVEAASVVTGGIGSEFGGQVGEEAFGPTGKMLGQMIGGVSGGMTPLYFKTAGATIFNGVKSIATLSKDRANMMESVAKTKILAAIGDNPQSQPNIERADQLSQEVPGFKPNLAAAADSEGLAQIQARLDNQSMENYNTAVENIRKSEQAINDYYAQTFVSTGNRLTATKKFREIKKDLKDQTKIIDKKIEKLEKQYQRRDTTAMGDELLALRRSRKQSVSNAVNAAYEDLYRAADDLGVIDDVTDLYLLADDFKKLDATVFQKMPAVLKHMREIFGDAIDPGKPFSDRQYLAEFPLIHSLYKRISKDEGRAYKTGDNTSLYYLGQIRELLDGKLAKFDDEVYGNFAKRKKATDTFWREQYQEVFREGVGGRMAYTGKWGQVTAPEHIVKSLVMKKGTATGIDQFNRVYEGIPEAQTFLREGILDMFASKVIKEGSINDKQVRSFLDDYKQVFDKVEDMRNTFMNSEALTTALVNRKANVIYKSKQFASQSISPYAKLAGYNTPMAAVEAGLSDPKTMRILTRNAKTEAEKLDISKLVADVVLEKTDPWQFIQDNEAALAKHFNRLKPGHFRVLKNIAETRNISNRYKLSGTSKSRANVDPFYQKFGTTLASAWSQWRFAYLYNKTHIYYPAIDMGSKYLSKIKSNKVDELLERSLYDPDLATTIDALQKVKGGQMADLKTLKLFDTLGMHAINNGIRNNVVALPDDEQSLEDSISQ